MRLLITLEETFLPRRAPGHNESPDTATGRPASVCESCRSEFIQASGSWINDRTHGVQFNGLVKGHGANYGSR